MAEFNKSLMRDIDVPILKSSQKQETCGMITDAKGDYVLEGDSLEKHIQLEINAKHPKYNEFILKLQNLLSNGSKESGLILFSSGI